MNLSEERRKLTATWVNSIASGAIVTGYVAPTIAITLNIGTVGIGLPVAVVSLA